MESYELDNLSEQELEDLVESIDDKSNLSVEPVHKDRWTADQQYYAILAQPDNKDPEVFILRFENKWHQAGVKIGKKTRSLTIHPLDLSGKKQKTIHKTIKKIKYPLAMISGVLKAIEVQRKDYAIEGFMLFLEPKIARYGRLINKIYTKKAALKSKFDFSIMQIGDSDESKTNGLVATLNIKSKHPLTVFEKLVSVYLKLGLKPNNLNDLTSMPEFASAAAKQMQKATQKTASLKIDIDSLFMGGEEKEYNSELRKYIPNKPKGDVKYNTDGTNEEIKNSYDDYLKLSAGMERRENEKEMIKSSFYAKMFSKMDDDGVKRIQSPNFDEDAEAIDALEQFTGNKYEHARKVMLGEYDENDSWYRDNINAGIVLIVSLDDTFSKYSHNISDYDGFVFRGIALRTKRELILDLLTNARHMLPSYTSFSFSKEIATNFGSVSRWLPDVLTSGIPDDVDVEFDITVDANDIESLKEKLQEYFGEDLTSGDHFIDDAGALMYSTGGHDKVNAIIPGIHSRYPAEAEIVVERSTIINVDKIRCIAHYQYDNMREFKRLKIDMLYGFTFDNPSDIITEMEQFKDTKMTTEYNSFGEYLVSEKKKDKDSNKPDDKKDKKDKKYTDKELKDLEKKFNSNPF